MIVSECDKLAPGTIIKWYSNHIYKFVITSDNGDRIGFHIGESSYWHTKSKMFDFHVCPKHTFLTRYKIL